MISANGLRKILLPAYYYGTLPGRRIALSLAARRGICPVAVLFYHRVADHTPNPWTISHRDFERQIDWLARRFDVISLAEAQRRMENRASCRPAACLTFDDGYAENCERALPWLCERKLPVTYFVASQFVLRGRPFPHDVERGEPLPANTVEQLRWLAAQGVEIGAHTRSHRDLGRVHARDELRDEIEGSRHDLQEAIGVPIRYFAFPYGQRVNLSRAAFEVARAAGFAGVCSAYGGYNAPGQDPFHVLRFHGDPDFLRFRNWLTWDPRQTRRADWPAPRRDEPARCDSPPESAANLPAASLAESSPVSSSIRHAP